MEGLDGGVRKAKQTKLFSMLQGVSPGARLSLNEQVAAGTGNAEELLGQGLHRASASLLHDVMGIAAPAAPFPSPPVLTPVPPLPTSSAAVEFRCHIQLGHIQMTWNISLLPYIFWVETFRGMFSTCIQGHGHPIKLSLSLKLRNLV